MGVGTGVAVGVCVGTVVAVAIGLMVGFSAVGLDAGSGSGVSRSVTSSGVALVLCSGISLVRFELADLTVGASAFELEVELLVLAG